MLKSLILVVTVWFTSNFEMALGKGVIVSLPGRSVQLRGEVADFGYQFDQQDSHPANLMLPPEENDPYLCEYPASLENTTRLPSSTPIALFVSRGECSFEQKANVALALQQNFTQDIRYVIIYNNDRNNPSQLIRMGSNNLELPTLGFLAVSTRAGSYTMSSILYYAEATQQDPYLAENVTSWRYPIDIEEFRSRSRGGAGANTFYLLRFVLFTLLILAPCLRALYLWWNGGGRVEFRRNDNGRITGLQYVRPTAYWFAPSGQGAARERPRLLTEQQVLDLPEITYVKVPGDDSDDEDDDSTEGTSLESSVASPLESPQQVTQSANLDVAVPLPVKGQQQEPEILVNSNILNDEETGQGHQDDPTTNEDSSPVPILPSPEGLTTSCTTCSICIDDFEDGERIRVLPKCRHGFHTDCLMPWLTERQGCCPLCKRSVLGPDDEDEVASSNDGELTHDEEQGVELGQVALAGNQQGTSDASEIQGQDNEAVVQVVVAAADQPEPVPVPPPQEPVHDEEQGLGLGQVAPLGSRQDSPEPDASQAQGQQTHDAGQHEAEAQVFVAAATLPPEPVPMSSPQSHTHDEEQDAELEQVPPKGQHDSFGTDELQGQTTQVSSEQNPGVQITIAVGAVDQLDSELAPIPPSLAVESDSSARGPTQGSTSEAKRTEGASGVSPLA